MLSYRIGLFKKMTLAIYTYYLLTFCPFLALYELV